MTLTKEARNYLDRYLAEVKRFLPKNKREDIGAELESYMLDSLEEENSEAVIADDRMKALLVKMGAPRDVANTYAPINTLIAPEIYPIFALVTRIVLIVVAIAIPVSMIIGMIASPPSSGGLISIFFEVVGGIWSGVTSALGTIVLIFYLVSRLGPEKLAGVKETTWDPDDLPELSKAEVPGVFDLAVTTTLTMVFVVFIFYLYVNDARLPIIQTGGASQIVAALPAILPILPFMAGIAILSIAKDSIIMVQGRWSGFTRLADLLLVVANIAVAGVLLSLMPLVQFEVVSGAIPSGFDQLQSLINLGLQIALIVGIVGNGIEIIKKLIQMIKAETGIPEFKVIESK